MSLYLPFRPFSDCTTDWQIRAFGFQPTVEGWPAARSTLEELGFQPCRDIAENVSVMAESLIGPDRRLLICPMLLASKPSWHGLFDAAGEAGQAAVYRQSARMTLRAFSDGEPVDLDEARATDAGFSVLVVGSAQELPFTPTETDEE